MAAEEVYRKVFTSPVFELGNELSSYSETFVSQVLAWRTMFMPHVKVVIGKRPEGYVAFPLGIKGVVVSQGNSYNEVLSDVTSAIRFHIETFGPEVIEDPKRSPT